MKIITVILVSSLLLLSSCKKKNETSDINAESFKNENIAEKTADKAEDMHHEGDGHNHDGLDRETNGQIPAPKDVAKAPENATVTASGLAYAELKAGDGINKPKATDTVKVHYTGWTTDGKMFDSSVVRGEAIDFPLNAVIPGWTEAVQLMSLGAKHRVWIPENLAYKGIEGRPKGMLVFDIELLDIKKAPEIPEDVAAAPESAVKTESGLAYRFLKESDSSEKPGTNDDVEIHYTGWTADGKMFDSSVLRGEAVRLKPSQLIKGWEEALKLMPLNSKMRVWIPENLAFEGKQGYPAGTLVFDLELLKIHRAPETPADVAAPPADALKTESGLAYKVLKTGTGKVKPNATSKVRVHYSGWTTDGKLFDSSVVRGESIDFNLDGVIKGWTEGVQLMVEGEKTRFWIPENLAYAGNPHAPQGMLVFDVELISIVEK